MHQRHALFAVVFLAAAAFAAGCSDSSSPPASTQPPGGPNAGANLTPVTLALNWFPEPEFGGFYAANIGPLPGDPRPRLADVPDRIFAAHHLAVTIEPSGQGAPIVQRVATGQVPFGIVSADDVVMARAHGQGVVAIFAVYQTCPQGIMVHAARHIASLQQLFETPGTIAMESGAPYRSFLEKKYGFDKVKVVNYIGGIAQFLEDKDYSQQCFITSEPLDAKKKGGDPQTFLVADVGYNPYTAVVATSNDYLKDHRQTVQDFVAAVREGWESYLKNPSAANDVMAGLNTDMDRQTFTDAAKAQAPLIDLSLEPVHHEMPAVGSMTEARWAELTRQLADLDIIKKDDAPKAADCFENIGGH